MSGDVKLLKWGADESRKSFYAVPTRPTKEYEIIGDDIEGWLALSNGDVLSEHRTKDEAIDAVQSHYNSHVLSTIDLPAIEARVRREVLMAAADAIPHCGQCGAKDAILALADTAPKEE